MGKVWLGRLIWAAFGGLSLWACTDDDLDFTGHGDAGAAAGEAPHSRAGSGVGGEGSGRGGAGGQPSVIDNDVGGEANLPPSFCEGVDEGGLALSELCSEQPCPTLVTLASGRRDYSSFDWACYPGTRSSSDPHRYGSSCGGFAINVLQPGGFVTWHFDENDELVGAEVREFDFEKRTCHTKVYGRSCVATGKGENLCSSASYCTGSLTEVERPSKAQVLCDVLCEGDQGYRLVNDCGGVNLVREDTGIGRETREWSFDAQGKLVGFVQTGVDFSRICDNGEWAPGTSYGKPCHILDPNGYGMIEYTVCKGVGDPTDEGVGGASGLSQPSSNGLIPLDEAELCGVDCGAGDLDTYCNGRGANSPDPWCPTPFADGEDYYGVSANCGHGWNTTVSASSCGHTIDVQGPSNGATWHFDEQWQLVGAELERAPQRLGKYCKTQTLGQVCTPQGAPQELCWEGGCQQAQQIHPTLETATQCPQIHTYQVSNDCGGLNIEYSGSGERGYTTIESFDANGTWQGSRIFSNEEGTEIHDCPEGGLGAGYIDGKLCAPVGTPTLLCAD